MHSLRIPRLKERLRKTLVAAGSPNYYTPEEYLAVAILAGLVLGGGAAALHVLIWQDLPLAWLTVGFWIGCVGALLQLRDKARTRLRDISRRLPYALDLISLAMGAGATFAEAVATIVRESPSDPLNVEFKTVLAEMELGTTRRRSLENLASRVPLEAMRSLIASVVQAEELGAPLRTVLHDQATLLRLNRSVRAEDLAARASVRILLPCLLLVVAAMIAVMGPMVIRYIHKGLF